MGILLPVLSRAIREVLQLPLEGGTAALSAQQPVKALFANNEQGDFARYMGELGPELVTNGDFSDGGYTFIEMMDAAKSGRFLSGKGVWRLSKPETNYAYGADRSDP